VLVKATESSQILTQSGEAPAIEIRHSLAVDVGVIAETQWPNEHPRLQFLTDLLQPASPAKHNVVVQKQHGVCSRLPQTQVAATGEAEIATRFDRSEQQRRLRAVIDDEQLVAILELREYRLKVVVG